MDKKEADLIEAQDAFIAAKAKRKVCPECGAVKSTPAVEKEVDKARDILRAKRAAWRKARAGDGSK